MPAKAAQLLTPKPVLLQVLAEKPADPVDVLETALLVKKESGSTGSSASLVEPVPVSPHQHSAPLLLCTSSAAKTDMGICFFDAATCSCSQVSSSSQTLWVSRRAAAART